MEQEEARFLRYDEGEKPKNPVSSIYTAQPARSRIYPREPKTV